MAVIKCSNCENEILDTEIVCPYCDCPVSETIEKIKKDNQTASSVKEKPAEKTAADEVPPATGFDFAKEKAAILRDLGIKDPNDKSESSSQADGISGDTSTISIDKTTIDVPMEETVKFSRDITDLKAVSKANVSAEKETGANSDPARRPGSAQRPPVRKPADSSRPPVRKNPSHRPPVKKGKNKSAGKYAILAVTLIGIAVVIYLIWGITGSISTNINKTKKTNKIVKVVDSSAQSDADTGFELHSSTLTITSDDVMIDYDSPQDTPWYEHKDKIKHVTFGKDVTRIGAHAFEGYDNITDINISDSVKFIGESAFCNCTKLIKITNMSKNIEEIDDYAFTGCKNLAKIPGYTEEADFDPSLERVGVEAFKSCKSLPAFKVAAYTQIDDDAFFGHGDDFAIICRTSSEAYEYASEKGIPTKKSFDAEEETEVEYIPAPTEEDSSTKKDNSKKDISRNNEESKTKDEKENTNDSTKENTSGNSSTSSTSSNEGTTSTSQSTGNTITRNKTQTSTSQQPATSPAQAPSGTAGSDNATPSQSTADIANQIADQLNNQ